MTPISVWIPGIPKAQPRARAFSFNGRARMYDPGTAEAWKQCIAQAVAPHVPKVPLEGPLRVDIDLFFPRPKRLCRKCDPDNPLPHVAKPDRDNAEKAVLDALTQLGVWRDDCQVCQGAVRKWYAGKGSAPGAILRIQDAMVWGELP